MVNEHYYYVTISKKIFIKSMFFYLMAYIKMLFVSFSLPTLARNMFGLQLYVKHMINIPIWSFLGIEFLFFYIL